MGMQNPIRKPFTKKTRNWRRCISHRCRYELAWDIMEPAFRRDYRQSGAAPRPGRFIAKHDSLKGRSLGRTHCPDSGLPCTYLWDEDIHSDITLEV